MTRDPSRSPLKEKGIADAQPKRSSFQVQPTVVGLVPHVSIAEHSGTKGNHRVVKIIEDHILQRSSTKERGNLKTSILAKGIKAGVSKPVRTKKHTPPKLGGRALLSDWIQSATSVLDAAGKTVVCAPPNGVVERDMEMNAPETEPNRGRCQVS
ncbi:uncharacterized protein LOC120151816 [Hibiscus syriacus]|uniref:uncharacterized protein LOC120151816 n=1 Tax=Hibiscus syriacus TaxID=106335 RepID=UPI001920CBD0|nr:uncharacterized protein LOC120151816 [Hibiscus syriacus]